MGQSSSCTRLLPSPALLTPFSSLPRHLGLEGLRGGFSPGPPRGCDPVPHQKLQGLTAAIPPSPCTSPQPRATSARSRGDPRPTEDEPTLLPTQSHSPDLPLPQPSSLSLWGTSQPAWLSQEFWHLPFSFLHPISDLTPCMSPWHFGDFELDACSFLNKVWMEHTGLCGGSERGQGQCQVSLAFWDLWAMGAGGGRPDLV